MLQVWPEDRFYLSSRNLDGTTGIRLKMSAVLYNAQRRTLAEINIDQTPATDGSNTQTNSVRIGFRGLVIQGKVEVVVVGGSPTVGRQGDVYAGWGLSRSGVLLPLDQGHLGGGDVRAWPPGRHDAYGTGPGTLIRIAGSNPAAGVETGFTVPNNTLWEVHAWEGTLVATGAANREVALVFDDGTTDIMELASGLTQTDTQTILYVWSHQAAASYTAAQGALRRFNSMPVLRLMPAARIRTEVANLAAGDDWGAPSLLVRRWVLG